MLFETNVMGKGLRERITIQRSKSLIYVSRLPHEVGKKKTQKLVQKVT